MNRPLSANAPNAENLSETAKKGLNSNTAYIAWIVQEKLWERQGVRRMAKNFENGVSFYTEGKIELSVFFPEGDVRCKWCRFCRAEESLGRFWCRLTNKMIYNPNFNGLPDGCPITIKKEEC